jgi:large conductance mechanosensitive channel
MIRGFKDFILRGNVVDLAVAVVIGSAFGAVVTSFVDSFIRPLIELVPAIGSDGGWEIKSGVVLAYGDFLTAVVTFLAIATVVYFLLVLPMNTLAARRKKGQEPEPAKPSEDILLLQQIRDALVEANRRN